MPQLVPFYFLNQIFWGYAVLFIILYLSSKVVLPNILSTYLTRMYITTL